MSGVSFREYSSPYIRRMWVDWPGMGLPIFSNPCFGPIEPGLCLGCYGGIRAWHGPHCSFGLASGILGPFLYPYQYHLLTFNTEINTQNSRSLNSNSSLIIK